MVGAAGFAGDRTGRVPEPFTAQVNLARRRRYVDPLDGGLSRALHPRAQLGQRHAGPVRAEPGVLQVERQFPIAPLEPGLVGPGDLREHSAPRLLLAEDDPR
jgi:hypothetical protein